MISCNSARTADHANSRTRNALSTNNIRIKRLNLNSFTSLLRNSLDRLNLVKHAENHLSTNDLLRRRDNEENLNSGNRKAIDMGNSSRESGRAHIVLNALIRFLHRKRSISAILTGDETGEKNQDHFTNKSLRLSVANGFLDRFLSRLRGS